MTKLLNFVGHDALELNNIKMFSKLGYTVQTTGAYVDHVNPNESNQLQIFRRKLNGLQDTKFDLNLSNHFKTLNPNGYYPGKSKLNLDGKFIDSFDVFIFSWILEPLHRYPSLFKNKKLFFHTLGQSNPTMERELKHLRSKLGLKIIRISEIEKLIEGYCGEDAIIDLDVDTDHFSGWTGSDNSILTINSHILGRFNITNFKEYLQVTDSLSRKLYGGGNPSKPLNYPFILGPISEENLLKEYKNCDVFFSLGTKPCPVVLSFKEALSVGMPVVTWGPKLGGKFFEAYKYIENEKNGFYSDDPGKLREYCLELLVNDDLRREVSKGARHAALTYFSRNVISKKWQNLIERGS